jgi:hypothetical protein
MPDVCGTSIRVHSPCETVMECIDPRDGFFENNAALDARLSEFQGQQNAYDSPDGWSSNWEHDRVNFYVPPDSDLTTACSLWDEISNASPPTEVISQRHPQTMYETFYDILQSQGSTNGQSILGKHGLASIRDIRDDLVHLYFIHVHAILPIIDEHAFMFIYNQFNKEEDLTKYLDLVLLQAIMFSGFAVSISTSPVLSEVMLKLLRSISTRRS